MKWKKQNNSSPALTEEQERNRMRRAALIKMGAMGIFVLVVLVFSSIAWFTMSREVEGTGAQMTASNVQYELSVNSSIRSDSNTVTAYDTILSNTLGYDTTELSTGGEYSSIKWVMTDESRTGTAAGLKPGSHGTLVFNVIPKNAGTLKLHFDLDLTGYYAVFAKANGAVDPTNITAGSLETLASRITTDSGSASKYSSAINYLNGHILFYEQKSALSSTELPSGTTDSNAYYSKRIDLDNGFDRTFTVTDAMVGTELPVTIYWIWPNTFAQIEYENGNNNLIDPAMFSINQPAYALPDESTITPRAELLAHIAEHPERFFNSTIISGKTTAELTTMLSLSNADDIITLSNGYNNADQVIGETVKLLLVELKADKVESAQ